MRSIVTNHKTVLMLLLGLFLIFILSSCIEINYSPDSSTLPREEEPPAVQKMKQWGYDFVYHENSGTIYWEADNSQEGWNLRIYKSGDFGMSGEYDKDYDAQTNASIDFFTALDVTPEQASFTAKLVILAMNSSDGVAEDCSLGLCCQAVYIEDTELYMWMCR